MAEVPSATPALVPPTAPTVLAPSGNTIDEELVQHLGEPMEGPEFKRIEILGKGTFGEVYRTNFNEKNYAVKCIPFSFDKDRKDNLELLKREVAVLRSNDHKHVVKFYGYRIQQDAENRSMKQIQLLLEYCEFRLKGHVIRTLEDYRMKIGNGALDRLTVRKFTRQVLEALLYLHSKGTQHRDIKPENILLDANGDVKVADFGCSKILGRTTIQAGGKQQTAGTGSLWFAAPEVYGENLTTYGLPIDVWSLGCLVLVLFGRLPWANENGLAPTSLTALTSLMKKHDSKPNVSFKRTECSDEIYDFLERCFDKNPQTRATCQELLDTPWMKDKKTTQ